MVSHRQRLVEFSTSIRPPGNIWKRTNFRCAKEYISSESSHSVQHMRTLTLGLEGRSCTNVSFQSSLRKLRNQNIRMQKHHKVLVCRASCTHRTKRACKLHPSSWFWLLPQFHQLPLHLSSTFNTSVNFVLFRPLLFWRIREFCPHREKNILIYF